MTDKDLFNSVQIELNKEQLPVMLLEQFNYFTNRAINQYVNKRYNLYDTSQQTTDDLQVLTGTVDISLLKDDFRRLIYRGDRSKGKMDGTTPLGNSIANYRNESTIGSYQEAPGSGTILTSATPDSYNQDSSHINATFTIASVGTSGQVTSLGVTATNPGTGYYVGDVIEALPLNTYSGTGLKIKVLTISGGGANGPVATFSIVDAGTGYTGSSVDGINIVTILSPAQGEVTVTKTQRGYMFPLPSNYYHLTNCSINYKMASTYLCYPANTIQSFGTTRLSAGAYNSIINDPFKQPIYKRAYYIITDTINNTAPSLEILTGDLSTLFDIDSITVDYLRVPTKINLTTIVLNDIGNVGVQLEFPDYVAQEIIREIVTIYLEHTVNPRLQTQIQVAQSIPSQLPQQAS